MLSHPIAYRPCHIKKLGFTACLDQGGLATGATLHLDRNSEEEKLSIIWDREMITGTYKAIWVTVVTEDGPLPAITFVANRYHPHYLDKQSDDEIVKKSTTAEGCLGAAHDYLKQSICELGKLGWRKTELQALEKRVSRYKHK